MSTREFQTALENLTAKKVYFFRFKLLFIRFCRIFRFCDGIKDDIQQNLHIRTRLEPFVRQYSRVKMVRYPKVPSHKWPR